jgi:pimeloyl-ACP methyl ester carboxylesterase
VDLAFDDSGGPGPAVVCLPMFNTTRATSALALGPALAGSGVREIYVDAPGHGDSPVSDPADSETVLAAVVTWLENHLAGPVRLAGCSYGGYLAAAIARRRPDLVEGLLLVCPGVRARMEDRELPDTHLGPAPDGWLDDAPADLREHLDGALATRSPEVVARVVRALAAGGPGDEPYRQALRAGEGFVLSDEDDDTVFPGPVAVVTGRCDQQVGHADQYRAMRRYPNGTFAVIDGAGHYLPFEQPALLRAHAQDWLRRPPVD